MRILTRYVLRHFIEVFTLALFGFVGIYLVVDFFEKFDDILQKGASFSDALLYFSLKLPFVATQGIPMAVLLSVLIGLGILQRNREIIALKAAGLSAWAYAGPIIVVSLLITGCTFYLGEFTARSCLRDAERVWHEKMDRRKPKLGFSGHRLWLRGHDTIYQVRSFAGTDRDLLGVTIFFFSPSLHLKQRIDVERLHWDGSRWIGFNGCRTVFQKGRIRQDKFQRRPLELDEKPDDFAGIRTLPEELNWLELFRYARKLKKEGYDTTGYLVELHTRLALPMTVFIFAIFGIAISLHLGHQGGIAMGIGLGLLMAFLYLVIFQIGSSLSSSGLLPPAVGVWSADVLFAMSGGYLWSRAPQ